MKLLLIFSKQKDVDDTLNLFAKDFYVLNKYFDEITVMDFGCKDFLKRIWQERKNYDIVLSNLSGFFISICGIFWRLADKKIWWFNNAPVRRFNLTFLSWLSDRCFYSKKESFMASGGSAEFLSGVDYLKEIFSVSLDASHSKLKIISPTFGRYIFSGLIVVGVNILSLAFLTTILGWWYLTASVCSFFVAFVVSFVLQKTLTYRDSIWRTWNWQLAGYFLVSLLNLACNTLILYILVDWVGLNYLLAQAFTVGLISFVLFFVYGRLIFRPQLEN